MALTTCPDCGKQVSDKAPTCPNCGCPIAKPKQNKTVRIALPNTDALSGGGIAGLLIAKNATVFAGLELLWSGKHGQTAIFDIDTPTKVTIDLGKWANDVTGTVSPGHRYQLVQDMSPHMFATFRLSEVDVIDSGM